MEIRTNTKITGPYRKATVATSWRKRDLLSRGIVKIRAAFDYAGRQFVAIETLTDKIEIYDHYPNGMERFMGYLGDRSIRATLAIAAVEALCSRPRVR